MRFYWRVLVCGQIVIEDFNSDNFSKSLSDSLEQHHAFDKLIIGVTHAFRI